MQPTKRSLTPLEHEVMRVIWKQSPCNVDQIRRALEPQHSLKESTIRTLLRRMEEKLFVRHKMEGRTYLYSEALPAERAAAAAVRQIIDRFCGGSAERLIAGMVDDEIIDIQALQELAAKINGTEPSEEH